MVKEKNSMSGLEAKFWQLLEHRDLSAREGLLGETRVSDPEMAVELEKMLAAHGKVADFLELADNRELNRTGRLVATIDSHPTADRASLHVPERTGPYKLLEPIGEGVMVVVYLAQQSNPIRRRVALKVIKPGMDSRQVIARFEAERQALAKMEHPNIAKVLDAGTTEKGRPYFVMELVRSIPITEYCDRSQTTIRKRLELVRDACHAIQHAHTKGIIHRDIKPSNVLVTENDGNPLVKVIDFGVAKALTDSLTEKTMYTGVFPDDRYATVYVPRAGLIIQPGCRYSQRRLFARRRALLIADWDDTVRSQLDVRAGNRRDSQVDLGSGTAAR